MAHGGGGRLSQQLLDKIFLPSFQNPILGSRHDGALLEAGTGRLAFTTDAYVVHPIFFPGGDIGTLAVNGTVNDLAMCGARPRWLSAAFIIEEGLAMETLWRVALSMKQAAAAAGIAIVTGDTKVVNKGKGDELFITTAGVGQVEHSQVIAPNCVRPGDAVLLSGDLGRHGMAIMSVRDGLEFESSLRSDCAPLAEPVLDLLKNGIHLHCLRDLTRGGLASALNEIATAGRVQIDVEELAIPVTEEVRGACELLGFDPLYVANEGRFVVFLPESEVAAALGILRRHTVSGSATRIGQVSAGAPGLVTIRSRIGAERILDLLTGEQLPRIC
ncbi:MAG: hydrogenase expression/formation protein HypE [Verrucomicrobiota bacterium]